MTEISKKEAKALFDQGIDIGIGGHDSKGEGARWKASQFGKSNFSELCKYFKKIYCRGVGRFMKIEFYRL